ncbi:uncharacterized protein LOC120090567 [Benincasa hispida]|uniref:uncharacterized protein LOC120090567 n=1 Tax=Benincasa hispida TaxID=102211 RepID=UPI00190005C0|nr:uncharacterized protein LOC120090567 [Benincasa hispida]
MAPPVTSPGPVNESKRGSFQVLIFLSLMVVINVIKLMLVLKMMRAKTGKTNNKDVIEIENDGCESLVPVENIVESGKEMSSILAENTVESGKMIEHETYEQEGECSMKSEKNKDRDASLDLLIALRKGTRSCTKYPLQSYLSYSNLSHEFKALTTSLDTVVTPNNIHTTLKISEWKAAVMEEMGALEKNHSWDQVTLPNGHKVVESDDASKIDRLKTKMAEEFEIKDLRKLGYFLRMEVARSREEISVSQRKYTLDVLKKTGMAGCKPIDTPIEVNAKLSNLSEGVPVNKERYQRLVGKLIYLSHTRLDISYVLSMVSHFMQSLNE